MPIFHINPQGNMGNRMIQFLVAKKLESLVADLRISNAVLPEWEIEHPSIEERGRIFECNEWQFVPFAVLQQLFMRDLIDCVTYGGFGQRIENFPDWQQAASYFRTDDASITGFSERHLVINIRGGEVLDGRNQGYVLVPVDFYMSIVARTGLSPVFMGQIADNAYCQALRHAFPDAEFLASGGPLHDFEILRRSVNMIPAVSTFSWLACWLSKSARQIFMPMTGLLNPLQSREPDFAPTDDPRFRFFWFPANYASPVEDFEKDHGPLLGRYREMDAADLARMKSQPPVRPKRLEDYAPHFDEKYYAQRYDDIRHALTVGLQSGFQHYIGPGFKEGREPLRCDRHWYVRTYPEAADDIGLGLYEDPIHHFVCVGARRGYLATPPLVADAGEPMGHTVNE
jgi:hypothetical protein